MTDFSQLQVPGPTVTQLTQPFWDGVTKGALRIQHCSTCAKYVFYPRPLCPYCWHNTLVWQNVSGRATLKSFSEIWKPGHPNWGAMAPYLVGLVHLSEGPTMMSHILAEDNDVTVGDELVFKPVDVGGTMLPLFCKITERNDT